ncbi:MAG: GNAT family N-acetyltransferase [Lachnospirales bacterium]
MDIKIRFATKNDIPLLLKIYTHYVLNTAITFEIEPPTILEFENRMENIQKKYPYIVAIHDNHIVGYAYAKEFVNRKAYDWSVESTIYIDVNKKNIGIGGKLMDTLENILKAMGICNIYACIAYSKENNPFLTNNSMDFHKYRGYKVIGEFNNCGYKFDSWYNMIYMEKIIGEHIKSPPAIININSVKL